MTLPPQGAGVKLPMHRYDDLEVFLTDNYKLLETESDEIDTSAQTSPVTVITPPTGYKVDVRGAFLFTDSSAGEITAYFVTSNKVLGKLYASRFASTRMPKMRKVGQVGESVAISWSGLSVGAKIFYVILYKFVKD